MTYPEDAMRSIHGRDKTADREKRLSHLLIHILTSQRHIMSAIDDLQAKADAVLAKVSADDDIINAIKTLVEGQAQQLLDLKAQLDAAGQDPAKLQALSDTLQAIADKTDAQQVAEQAIAGTPAAEPPPADQPPAEEPPADQPPTETQA